MDLRALFEEAVGQVAPQAQAKGIHVDVEISPDLAAWVDAGSIERVLVNLLGNVVKFTLRGGRVEMCRQEDGDGVLLWVRDSGPGIPPEDQARIFDRFTQAGQRRQWGSGLGLALCKLAVKAHGERIRVESESGEGSTFRARLPRGSAKPRGRSTPVHLCSVVGSLPPSCWQALTHRRGCGDCQVFSAFPASPRRTPPLKA